MSIDSLPTLHEVVKLHGLAADKRLGQHFLLDMNITDKIARLASPFEQATLVEIGPGPGGLTRSLFKAGAKNVIAIEMDERFVPALSDIGDASNADLRIIRGDALKVDISKEAQGKIKIAANLPYNVGTKMLTNWLTANPLFWSRAVLMFQKEVAERVVAGVGDKAYGRLAILSNSVCQTHLAFTVPAHAFSPPPKVDSAVVVLDVLESSYPHLIALGQLTAAAFGQRRKMLRKSLKSFAIKHGITIEAWCEACDVLPTKRPEELDVAAFQSLTNYLIKNGAKHPQ